MDRSVVPSSGVDKTIIGAAIASVSAVDLLMQEELDHRVRHGLCVTTNRVDVLVGQLPRLVTEQFSAPRNRDGSGMRAPPLRSFIDARRGLRPAAREVWTCPDHHAIADLWLDRGSRQDRSHAGGVGRASARRLDGNESEPTIDRVMVRLVRSRCWGACCGKARADTRERGGR